MVDLRLAGLLSVLCVTSGCYGHARRDAPTPPSESAASEMISIPAGVFTMGDRNGEPDEYPERQVTISAFRIDKTEVTNGAYKLCVQARACDPAAYLDDPKLGLDDHPVLGVAWDDAVAFCRWVKKRLPTEAEWEYAAKGGDLRKWPWEGGFKAKLANTREGDGESLTTPVGTFPEGASPFGVLDLAGNAAEWVADYFDPTIYRTVADPRDPKGPDSGRERVVRGGSYLDASYLVRVSARRAKLPTDLDNSIGFRCAR
ncbi:formylglycine-generating enzyme family protein [Myxococcota bacterium]|nr:formylglycine-generating enzyme family protein [Myxococcota bacterium]